MVPQEALDDCDTHLDAMVGGPALGNLTVRQIRPLDRSVHG